MALFGRDPGSGVSQSETDVDSPTSRFDASNAASRAAKSTPPARSPARVLPGRNSYYSNTVGYRIQNSEYIFLTQTQCTEGLGRIEEWIVSGQTPRA